MLYQDVCAQRWEPSGALQRKDIAMGITLWRAEANVKLPPAGRDQILLVLQGIGKFRMAEAQFVASPGIALKSGNGDVSVLPSPGYPLLILQIADAAHRRDHADEQGSGEQTAETLPAQTGPQDGAEEEEGSEEVEGMVDERPAAADEGPAETQVATDERPEAMDESPAGTDEPPAARAEVSVPPPDLGASVVAVEQPLPTAPETSEARPDVPEVPPAERGTLASYLASGPVSGRTLHSVQRVDRSAEE